MERLEAQKILHMALDTELAIGMLEMEQAAKIGKPKTIYCGTEDYVEFFKYIVDTLDLHIDYEIEDVDGELEVVVYA